MGVGGWVGVGVGGCGCGWVGGCGVGGGEVGGWVGGWVERGREAAVSAPEILRTAQKHRVVMFSFQGLGLQV